MTLIEFNRSFAARSPGRTATYNRVSRVRVCPLRRLELSHCDQRHA